MAKGKLVREIMVSDVKTVDESKSVRDVVALMAQHKIGAIVVVNKDKAPVGIFTERDLVMKILKIEGKLSTPVAEIMTADLVCVQMDDSADILAEIMMKHGFRHIPVVDDYKLKGIISIRDVLHYLAG